MAPPPFNYLAVACIIACFRESSTTTDGSDLSWSSSCATGGMGMVCQPPDLTGGDRSTMLQHGLGVHWAPPSENRDPELPQGKSGGEGREQKQGPKADQHRARSEVVVIENVVAKYGDREKTFKVGESGLIERIEHGDARIRFNSDPWLQYSVFNRDFWKLRANQEVGVGNAQVPVQAEGTNDIQMLASAMNGSINALGEQLGGFELFAQEVAKNLPTNITGQTVGVGNSQVAVQAEGTNDIQMLAGAMNASINTLGEQVGGFELFAQEVAKNLPTNITGQTAKERDLSVLKNDLKATLQGLGSRLNSIKSSVAAISTSVPVNSTTLALSEHVGAFWSLLQLAGEDLDACLQVLSAALSFVDRIRDDDAAQQFRELDANLLRGIGKVHAAIEKYERAFDKFVHGVLGTAQATLPDVDGWPLLLLKQRAVAMGERFSTTTDQIADQIILATEGPQGLAWGAHHLVGAMVLALGSGCIVLHLMDKI